MYPSLTSINTHHASPTPPTDKLKYSASPETHFCGLTQVNSISAVGNNQAVMLVNKLSTSQLTEAQRARMIPAQVYGTPA